jgi:hypothetical protein
MSVSFFLSGKNDVYPVDLLKKVHWIYVMGGRRNFGTLM